MSFPLNTYTITIIHSNGGLTAYHHSAESVESAIADAWYTIERRETVVTVDGFTSSCNAAHVVGVSARERGL